jgi:hypothetical protein
MRKLHEVIEYNYEGVTVAIKINYIKQQISLVDIHGNRLQDVKDKEFRFNNTNGKHWPKIMDAMKKATEEALVRMKEGTPKPPLNPFFDIDNAPDHPINNGTRLTS